MHKDILQATAPADVWGESYPVGNGRIGAMITGAPISDRIALNHDRLWRRYWKFSDIGLSKIFPEYQKLCLEKRFAEAVELINKHVPEQGKPYYVNCFVPAADLGIYHPAEKVKHYARTLDLDRGLATTTFATEHGRIKREYFASYPDGVQVTMVRTSRPGTLNDEVFLYRLPDEECQVQATSNNNELMLEGRFDEGVRFIIVSRVLTTHGSVEPALKNYTLADEPKARKHVGFTFGWREFPHPAQPAGVSLKIRNADQALILTVVTTDRECPENQDMLSFARQKLDKAAALSYSQLRSRHIKDHRKRYQRLNLELTGDTPDDLPAAINAIHKGGKVSPKVYELMFKFARYMVIASGRPQEDENCFKAPMNLQGMWNQEPRPPWDADYHLDLNLQMCYWAVGQVNLPEYGVPLVEWAWNLLPMAKEAASSVYGMPGACYTPVCDIESLGNCDNLCVLCTGVSAWLCQSLYQVWEYNHDKELLKERIYPIMRESGEFFMAFLSPDEDGRLITAPSGSPENCPKGYCVDYCMLSVMSTFDIELLRELFEHLITSAELLECDSDLIVKWQQVLASLPMPTLAEDGRLQEWLETEYNTQDPGHRHRSHLVGLLPGKRISPQLTPEYADGARLALELRHQHSQVGSCALDIASDAQIYARLHMAEEAEAKIKEFLINHAMGNFMSCICDWRPETKLNWFKDRRVFQLEANLGIMAAIVELLVQDRAGRITLLPALPKDWRDGEISGVLTRQGFNVEVSWHKNKFKEAIITPIDGKICYLELPWQIDCIRLNGHKVKVSDNGLFEFPTPKKRRYRITL